MNDKEKILLLDLILQDIRGNWGWNLYERIYTALEIAEELKLEQFVESIHEYIERCECGDDDGRFFRMSYSYGGYIGLEKIHGLPYKLTDRSKEFKRASEILTHPVLRFEDCN